MTGERRTHSKNLDIMPEKPVVTLHDRAKGMMLLGAYGDALGAPHEPAALGGGTTDPDQLGVLVPANGLLEPSYTGNEWFVWPAYAPIASLRGIPTDDTAYRLLLLHEWMFDCKRRNVAFHEDDFIAWLQQLPTQSTVVVAGVAQARAKQAAAWCDMYEAAQSNTNAAFFKPQVPVVFGGFQYLEMALVTSGSPLDVSKAFRRVSRLDQGSAHVVTGVWAGMLKALATYEGDITDLGTTWLAHADLLTQPNTAQNPEEARDLRTMNDLLGQMVDFAQTHATASPATFVEVFAAREYHASNRPWSDSSTGLLNFHPLLFWAQMVSAIAYCSANVLDALRILAAGPGDSDTVPSFLGSMLGAALGAERLARHTIGNQLLGSELVALANTLHVAFGIDIDTRAGRFAQIAPDQN